MRNSTLRCAEAERFVQQLEEALAGPLPGVPAQLKMSVSGRHTPVPSAVSPRQSAVLALMHPPGDEIALIFTLRPTSLTHHAGQISFPGGGVEPQDGTYREAALRETGEELGIATGDIQILGQMTPLFIAPSNNLVHPFVGWLPQLPPVDPDPVEVAAVLDVPLAHLLDPGSIGTYHWRRNGQTYAAPCYQVGRVSIWGATAMILSELLEVVRSLEA